MIDRRLAAALALAVILAGCGSVGPSSTPTPAEPEVTVEGGELSFDPATVYRRVADLQGLDYRTLPDVTVEVADRPDRNLTELAGVTRFERLLGIEPRAPDTTLAGLARPGEITLYTGVVTDPEQRERVLAHEFAHVVQFHQDAFETVDDRIGAGGGNETRLRTAVTEGAASYVERRYAVEYLGASPALPTWEQRRAGRSPFGAYVLAPYHFGERHVDGRIDSPADLPALYDDPPRSSEQLVHGYASDEEYPGELFVRFDGLDERSVVDRRTKGELYVRLVLEGELPSDRAADAAAGWGKDRLLVLEDEDGDRSYVWGLRWDTVADADAFGAAVRAFLDGHVGAPADGVRRDGDVAYRVERASDETVVVIVGDPGFVEAASASGADGEVTVTVDPDGGDG